MDARVRVARSAFARYWQERNSGLLEQSVNLGMGSPPLSLQPIPPALAYRLVEAASTQAVADYQPQVGDTKIRSGIAKLENARLGGGQIYSPHNVMVTHGALAAIDLILRSLKSDKPCAVFAPDYFNLVSLDSARLIPRKGDRLTLDDIEELEKFDFSSVLITNPNNPTGLYEMPQVMNRLLAVCRDRGALLVVDETCDCHVSSESNRSSWPVADEQLVRVNGLSKRFNCAGLRIGWILANEDVLGPIVESAPREYGNVSVPSSIAIGGFLEEWSVEDEDFERSVSERLVLARARAVEELHGLPNCSVMASPECSYYVTVALNNGLSGQEASAQLLHQFGLDVVPGEFFALDRASIRLCVAREFDVLDAGISRLREFLGRSTGEAVTISA